MKRPGILLFLMAATTVLLADHPGSIETALDDGGLATSKSFKSNYLIYRSIGGETRVQGKEKKRKWWCAWLCKRRVDKNAERITVANTYFSEVQPGVFAVLEREPRTCNDASSCGQKEWAAGLVVERTFPNGSTTPGIPGGLLPVQGVITRHEIVVDGRTIMNVTAAGKHPQAPPGPIL